MSKLTISPLQSKHKAESLSFLAARPQHTVFMTGLIRDNGFNSVLNRGTFYGCRNEANQLEGIALIGHLTIFETRLLRALKTFTSFAQQFPIGRVLFGERNKVEFISSQFKQAGVIPRKQLSTMLLWQQTPLEVFDPVPALHLATHDDLLPVMSAHAKMAEIESGVNPLEKDPDGFKSRTLRRIEQERVWVWSEQNRLIFKADIVSNTPDVIYIEGVYVAPERRGYGLGSRCMMHLSRELLKHTQTVSLLVDEKNMTAINTYRRAGFQLHSYYDSLFF